jgi:hypothetical protein
MIIGMSGKINVLWSHKINHTRQNEIITQTGNHFIYISQTSSKSLHNLPEIIPDSNVPAPDVANNIIRFIPFNDGFPNHRPWHSLHFRGPPHVVTKIRS